MSYNREIAAPYTLASLPSTGTNSGRTKATSVCSISGTKKRKRTEIAVGLDGEGISIYSIQNPHLVTSYALPPQTSLASAPYSVYRKGGSKRPRRYTYAFIAEDTPNSKPQLVCFAEVSRKDAATEIVKTSYTPSNTAQRVVAIDALPIKAGSSHREGDHDVLVVFDIGDVLCLSADLETVRWVANLNSLAVVRDKEYEVEHVSVNTARAVTHGILRSREDIAAILDPAMDGKSEILDLTQILCIVSRGPEGSRKLGLFQVHPRSPDLPTGHLQALKHITTFNIPDPAHVSDIESSSLHYSLHASTGAFHLLADSGLLSYDFSGTVPRLVSKSAANGTSFLRISQDLLFTASPSSCQILDAKYDSIQADISLGQSSNTSIEESKKRKHADRMTAEDPSSAPALVAYYADNGLVVGLWKNEIVGFQLGTSLTRKRTKKEGIRLIDSLGKGIGSHARSYGSVDIEDGKKWQNRKAKLDKYASKGKIAKFEALIAADLGIDLEEGTATTAQSAPLALGNGASDATTTNGVGQASRNPPDVDDDVTDDLPRKWRIPKSVPAALRLRHQRHGLYALSRIFRWIDSPSSQGPRGCLNIELFPPNAFQWLLQYGLLTKESIRRAILDDSTDTLDVTTPIRDGDIAQAIVDFDPELHILSAILNHGHFLPVGEVVQAIKLLMQGLDSQSKTQSSAKLLTNGTEMAEDAMDVDFASELEAASNEIDRALSMLDNDVVSRYDTLRPALIRLHTFPATVVSSTLRSMLPRRDLESLMRLLHHEFRNGGWTSPYAGAGFDDSSGPSADEADDSAVAIIASLLSCTLDAIGPAIWLSAIGGSSTEESTEDLIAGLLDDTSIALSGFWEATYIRGLVTELLRYATKLPKSQKPSNKTLERQGKPFALDLKPDELPMMPLGAKPDLGIEKTKTRGGKKKDRSAREMGMLISKRVPKYSFERVVI